MPAVDKSEPWTEGASCASCTSCTSKLPPPPSPQPARPGRRLAALRKESAYPRAEGVTWYPHPDPVTARTDDRTATSEQWADLKTHHAPALKKCRTPR